MQLEFKKCDVIIFESHDETFDVMTLFPQFGGVQRSWVWRETLAVNKGRIDR